MHQLPRAWLGYVADQKRFCAVRVCAYCPDKDEADRIAARDGFKVTHTICTECYQEQIAALTGENAFA